MFLVFISKCVKWDATDTGIDKENATQGQRHQCKKKLYTFEGVTLLYRQMSFIFSRNIKLRNPFRLDEVMGQFGQGRRCLI
jgi:hypothetical protein